MILNGKCKEDFEEYVKNLDVAPYVVMLENIPSCYLNALIIEFFDSVGIYINIENLHHQNWWSFKLKSFPYLYEEKLMKRSRQQATEKAIEKANEIYNK